MSRRVDRSRTILRAIVHEFRTERITFMAGSIAYNAFLSLLPFLFLLLAVVSAVGDRELESTMISLTEAIVTPGAGEVIVAELQEASAGASVLGIVVLGWGMLRIFRSIDMAFSDIYETQTENSLTDQIVDGVVVFGSLAAVVVGALVVESLVPLGGPSGLAWVAQRAIVVLVVGVALVPMYYLFPDESGMDLLEVLPGVGFTASALVAAQSLFGLYVEYSSQTAENTMLASIVVLLTWLYVSGLVLLLGAAINAVLSNRSEDVNVEPVFGGVPKASVSKSGTGAGRYVPEEELHRLNHAFSTGDSMTIVVDGDEFSMPTPEIATVDTDTSPLSVINDTASIRFQWSQDRRLDGE